MHSSNVIKTETLLNYIQKGFGGELEYKRFLLEDIKENATIVIGRNSPTRDLDSYSTVGLSNYELNGSTGKMSFRVELISAAISGTMYAEDILVKTYHHFVKNNVCMGPGQVLIDGIKYSRIESPHLEHIYLALPTGWQHEFDLLQFDDYDVRFLMPIGISDQEFLYLKIHGIEEFEKLVIGADIDIFDFTRNSIL